LRPGRCRPPGDCPEPEVARNGARVGWICAAAGLLAAAAVLATASQAADGDARPTAPAEIGGLPALPQDNVRVREGTQLADRLGHFLTSGGRVVFVTADGKSRLVGLENLNLERIARTIADSPHDLQWEVTGTITEYRGANFLLVDRAVLKSGMQSPAIGF
jgi:hypothetical protein